MTSGQETERLYSYNPAARTGRPRPCMAVHARACPCMHTYLIDMCLARVLLRHCRIPPVELVGIPHDVGEYRNFNVWISGRIAPGFDDEYRAVGVLGQSTG